MIVRLIRSWPCVFVGVKKKDKKLAVRDPRDRFYSGYKRTAIIGYEYTGTTVYKNSLLLE